MMRMRSQYLLKSTAIFLVFVNMCNSMTLPSVQLEQMASKGLLVRPLPNIYVLGSVHIGSKSANDVEILIEAVQPTNVVVEIPPSRLVRIQQKLTKMSVENQEEIINPSTSMGSANSDELSSKQIGFLDALSMFPAMASEGYSKGGISGLIFSTLIVWSSLLKRSTTKNEEAKNLPRRNEFEAAIFAGEKVGANIIAADMEFEDLVNSVAKSMTPLKWLNLIITISSEIIGLRPSDPVRRGENESMVDWEIRRRDIETARSSRAHGEDATPELSRVLVDMRDDKFSKICLESLEKSDRDEITVCIVGLVHLDGILDNICEGGSMNGLSQSSSSQ